MAAASDRSNPTYPDYLRKSLDEVMAAFAEHKVVNDKCAAAAEECVTTGNRLIDAAKTYMAAYVDLKISIVQLKAIIKCVAGIPGAPPAPPAHMKAMCDVTLGFYNATLEAHKTVVRVSKATDEAVDAYHAKNVALRAETAALDSKSDIASSKLAAFKDKLSEASRVLPEREVATLRTKVVTAAQGWDADKTKIAVAKQFAAAKAVEMVEKRCTDMSATRDAVANDINTAVNRMNAILEKHATDLDKMFQGIQRPPGG